MYIIPYYKLALSFSHLLIRYNNNEKGTTPSCGIKKLYYELIDRRARHSSRIRQANDYMEIRYSHFLDSPLSICIRHITLYTHYIMPSLLLFYLNSITFDINRMKSNADSSYMEDPSTTRAYLRRKLRDSTNPETIIKRSTNRPNLPHRR